MTVSALIAEFRQLVDQLGSAWNLATGGSVTVARPSAPRVACVNALTSEMELRAPADALKALREDRDIEVRAWAAARFDEADPDFARAAIAGICQNSSTRQALRLIEPARTPPPSRPTLAEMSLADLVARFSDACLREFWTRHCGEDTQPLDVELRNEIDDEVDQIVTELRRRGACDRLLPLLGSPNITERAEAARNVIARARASVEHTGRCGRQQRCLRIRASRSSLGYFRGRASRGALAIWRNRFAGIDEDFLIVPTSPSRGSTRIFRIAGLIAGIP